MEPNKCKHQRGFGNTVESINSLIPNICQLVHSSPLPYILLLHSYSGKKIVEMVVTRKTPLVPPPPTSRTNSSQPTPRTAKSKARAAPSALAVGDDLGAGPSYGPGNSSNGKSGPNDVVSEISSCHVRD